MKKGKRKEKRRISLKTVVSLFLTGIILLTGCGHTSGLEVKEGKTGLTKVTLNEVAHSIFYAPMYVAIENGYFEEEGIDLSLVTGFGADKTMTAVITGEADIGFMGSESTIYTYAGGTQDYVVNFAQLTQRAGNFLVCKHPIDHFEWSMLRGKEVLGGRTGGMPEMVFEYILRMNGLEPDQDVIIDKSVDFGATAAAFSGSDVEFTVEFEPHATLLAQKGDGYVVASLGEASGYVPYTSFSAKKSYIEANSDVILHFTKALQKGMDYVNSHTPAEIAVVIAPQFSEVDKEVLETIVKRYADQKTWKENLIFEKDAFDLLQNILLDSKVIEKRYKYDDLVNTSFAKKVLE